MLGHDPDKGPLVVVRNMTGQAPGGGATEIFVYAHDKSNLFAASVIALDRLRLSVYDANIRTSDDGLCFNTYVVLDENRQPLRGDRDTLVERMAAALPSRTSVASAIAGCRGGTSSFPAPPRRPW